MSSCLSQIRFKNPPQNGFFVLVGVPCPFQNSKSCSQQFVSNMWCFAAAICTATVANWLHWAELDAYVCVSITLVELSIFSLAHSYFPFIPAPIFSLHTLQPDSRFEVSFGGGGGGGR